jgi:hypothetical protein
MLKRKIKGWVLKKLGIKAYCIEDKISDFTIATLNQEQLNRFIPIKMNHLRQRLAEKLPVTFIRTDDPENKHITLRAYIYCMENKDAKNK